MKRAMTIIQYPQKTMFLAFCFTHSSSLFIIKMLQFYLPGILVVTLQRRVVFDPRKNLASTFTDGLDTRPHLNPFKRSFTRLVWDESPSPKHRCMTGGKFEGNHTFKTSQCVFSRISRRRAHSSGVSLQPGPPTKSTFLHEHLRLLLRCRESSLRLI